MSQPEQTQAPPPLVLPSTISESDPIPPPIVTTPKCIIRLLHPSDLVPMQQAADDPAVSKFMTYRFASPYTLEDAKRWLALATTMRAPGTDIKTSYAICDPVTNTYLGGIGLETRIGVDASTMELGYWIGRASWGKGIMTEAVRAFARWTFDTFPEVIRLEAGVYSGNEASVRVLRKAGFVFEGTKRKAATKHGVVFDTRMFGLLREECTWGKQGEALDPSREGAQEP